MEDQEAGQRLDVVLAAWLEESRSKAAGRITRGEVQIDGREAAKSRQLRAGESVEVAPLPERPSGPAGTPPPPVRYEDQHLLVVAKPAGIVVHPGPGHPSGTLVQALVAAGYRLAPAAGDHRPGIVHRLDKTTSGLLVVAKSDRAHAGLAAAFKRHAIDRAYLTLVEGQLPAVRGRVDAPIGRDPANRQRYAVVADGKAAVTHWRVRGAGDVDNTDGQSISVSVIVCRLETGRTHQIRVHLAYAGHPVTGDRRYGARRDLRERLGLQRPFLHAGRLAFDHPVSGHRVELYEPPPADLRAAGEAAGLTPGAVLDPLREPDGRGPGQCDPHTDTVASPGGEGRRGEPTT